tara:strand:+ start:729 stop:1697 length:969 start_codon:yes stop_codon:yes gene_type:complete
MVKSKYQVINSKTEAKFGNIFEYLGHYPQCNFIHHHVFDSKGFDNLPNRPDLPLLLWGAEEAFIEDTSSIDRDFVYVTGNYNLPNYFSIHDIISSRIWPNKIWSDNKTKLFNCTQLKDVGHRRSVISALYKANVLEKSNWSYVNNTCDGSWFHSELGFTQQDIDYAHSINDIIPYDAYPVGYAHNSSLPDIWHDSCLTISTETTFQHYSRQVPPTMCTEKTYCAIANLTMFIIAGPTGCLRLLRDQGYETFSDLWDESYDQINNTARRLRAVCSLIEEVSKMDLPKLHAHCKERLLHNQNILYNIDVKSRVDKITNWLLESH